MIRLVALLLIAAAPAMADCPPPRPAGDATATLLTELVNAPDEAAANAAAGDLWEIWLTAPDEVAQELLDRAQARREVFDFATAEELLDELVAYCPDYAEGYNQRAFVRFLREDYEGALADIAVVLETHPYHFGALSGKGLALLRQGRARLAQEALRAAVEIHPYLRERALLAPGNRP